MNGAIPPLHHYALIFVTYFLSSELYVRFIVFSCILIFVMNG
jgi:hypothetical protein